ncbi:unnamed protein product [Arctia plantaginis]|uniref:Uncharacterized protein n=1 Tax=Arctia plantaginis TaxID=874455 RepID=A0A8S1AZ53_ARCPL|nr:unnamed protein product [Arctia plantaginis]
MSELQRKAPKNITRPTPIQGICSDNKEHTPTSQHESYQSTEGSGCDKERSMQTLADNSSPQDDFEEITTRIPTNPVNIEVESDHTYAKLTTTLDHNYFDPIEALNIDGKYYNKRSSCRWKPG